MAVVGGRWMSSFARAGMRSDIDAFVDMVACIRGKGPVGNRWTTYLVGSVAQWVAQSWWHQSPGV